MNCLFCSIVKKEIPSYTIYEDDKVYAFLDINPSTNGDLMIVPKKHVETIMDIDDETLLYIIKITRKLYPILKVRLHCKGLTLAQNNDYGQDIKHFHLHLTPRYEEDDLSHSFNKDILMDLEKVQDKLKGITLW